MVRQFRTLIAAAALAALATFGTAVCAGQAPQSQPLQTQPDATPHAAPIQRAYQGTYQAGESRVTIAPGESVSPGANDAIAVPIAGVLLRVGPHSSVREVSSDPQKLELSVERGVANINVHKPAKDVLILVDLPGGQTQLLKNGLYTFDAQTDTARVLKGEALAFPGTQVASNEKPLKVKEDHKVVFNGTDVKSQEFPLYEARMDLLTPLPNPAQRGAAFYAYGYGPYGDGFYAPYWAYAPYPWGYPFYGYPYAYGPPLGLGIGIGYVGGWGGHYGGFHGGFHDHDFHGGGFHGGGFHGRR